MSAATLTPLDLPGPATTVAGRLRWAVTDSFTVARRHLAYLRSSPANLIAMVMVPLVLVLLFGFMFGNSIKVPPGVNYREYLLPGVFGQTVTMATVATAVGVAGDMSKGIIERFRSLPMARTAALAGRGIADLVGRIIGLVSMAVCGLLTGWRFHHGVVSMLAGFGMLLLFSFALSWVGAWVGMVAKSPENTDALATAVVFPLTFLANTFVPLQNLPSALRVVAEWNPLSATVAACRQLFGNPSAATGGEAWPLAHPVVASIAWSLVIIAVFLPLAVSRYRRAAH